MNDVAPRPARGLSLCAGGGGLDMGLQLAEPGFHTICAVEWEPYPRQCLIAAQRAGYMAPAPIWDDLTTFDGRPWLGVVDTVLAGYPCQPFSQAGQRKGADDPRHLWPHVARVILECQPRWVFLENVAGHVTLGAETVLRELWQMGWTPAAGLFSAGEVGAPHARLRWFCVAYRDTDADSGRMGARGHSGGARQGERQGAERERVRAGTWCGGFNVANAERDAGHERRHGNRRGSTGSEGKADSPCAPGAPLFPPPPGDTDAWAVLLASDPSRAPAVARRDLVAAAFRLAAMVPPDAAEAVEQRASGMALDGLLRALEEEAGPLVGDTQAFAGFRFLAHGMARRSRALRLLGNGVVPLCAGAAWRALSASHGLGPVDLEAACETPATATTEHV